jgi:phosphatidylserine decarboxylase
MSQLSTNARGAGDGPLTGGGVALHVPDSRAALNDFHAELMKTVRAAAAAGTAWSPGVQALAELIDADPIIRMFVEQMLAQVQELPGAPPSTVTTVDDLLGALDTIVTLAPLYNPDPAKRHAFPMSSLFAYMMMTVAGESLFRNRAYNAALQVILREWCAYLDGAESASVLNDGYTGWISPPAIAEFQLDQFVFDPSAPHGGWSSYNDFFHREIELEYRPLAGPDDPKVVVSANDGNLVSVARNVQRTDMFWLKASRSRSSTCSTAASTSTASSAATSSRRS